MKRPQRKAKEAAKDKDAKDEKKEGGGRGVSYRPYIEAGEIQTMGSSSYSIHDFTGASQQQPKFHKGLLPFGGALLIERDR